MIKWYTADFDLGVVYTSVELPVVNNSCKIYVNVHNEDYANLKISKRDLPNPSEWKSLLRPVYKALICVDDAYPYDSANYCLFAGYIDTATPTAFETISIKAVGLREYASNRIITGTTLTGAITDSTNSKKFTGSTWEVVIRNLMNEVFNTYGTPANTPRPPSNRGTTGTLTGTTQSYEVLTRNLVTIADSLDDVRDTISTAGNEYKFVPRFNTANRFVWDFVVGSEAVPFINSNTTITINLDEKDENLNPVYGVSNILSADDYATRIIGIQDQKTIRATASTSTSDILFDTTYNPGQDLTETTLNTQINKRLNVQKILQNTGTVNVAVGGFKTWSKHLGKKVSITTNNNNPTTSGFSFIARITEVSGAPESSECSITLSIPDVRYGKLPNSPTRNSTLGDNSRIGTSNFTGTTTPYSTKVPSNTYNETPITPMPSFDSDPVYEDSPLDVTRLGTLYGAIHTSWGSPGVYYSSNNYGWFNRQRAALWQDDSNVYICSSKSPIYAVNTVDETKEDEYIDYLNGKTFEDIGGVNEDLFFKPFNGTGGKYTPETAIEIARIPFTSTTSTISKQTLFYFNVADYITSKAEYQACFAENRSLQDLIDFDDITRTLPSTAEPPIVAEGPTTYRVFSPALRSRVSGIRYNIFVIGDTIYLWLLFQRGIDIHFSSGQVWDKSGPHQMGTKLFKNSISTGTSTSWVDTTFNNIKNSAGNIIFPASKSNYGVVEKNALYMMGALQFPADGVLYSGNMRPTVDGIHFYYELKQDTVKYDLGPYNYDTAFSDRYNAPIYNKEILHLNTATGVALPGGVDLSAFDDESDKKGDNYLNTQYGVNYVDSRVDSRPQSIPKTLFVNRALQENGEMWFSAYFSRNKSYTGYFKIPSIYTVSKDPSNPHKYTILKLPQSHINAYASPGYFPAREANFPSGYINITSGSWIFEGVGNPSKPVATVEVLSLQQYIDISNITNSSGSDFLSNFNLQPIKYGEWTGFFLSGRNGGYVDKVVPLTFYVTKGKGGQYAAKPLPLVAADNNTTTGDYRNIFFAGTQMYYQSQNVPVYDDPITQGVFFNGSRMLSVGIYGNYLSTSTPGKAYPDYENLGLYRINNLK